ncbi:thioredoxin reductase 1 cytoplasmic [Anaeramoeba ignava]|uniref:thioredoxin-disulfide reductase (NADPH) n=1 Tax=Anaeramoeba ignava TaxID=1746090 RepID=A0A9Q0L6C4_ANAIG|nr:thioredoxin reductase 1 cytoplasmic [Anaeramoeba ignava]|eukprot:Anaeramoba_ignava/a348449_184.p1 GENE.a348449_184~~a348449_184.p1  ORF type:complete len:525 (+),score=140.91 a348449_184:94-1668(+)
MLLTGKHLTLTKKTEIKKQLGTEITKKIFRKISEKKGGYQYDLAVIGGGSGGLSVSQKAAELGAKVALMDYVEPTLRGSKWGIGGACPNVGCIPKKLLHAAAQSRENLHFSTFYGWDVDPINAKHNWNLMINNVQSYIRSLNWGYKVKLRQKGIDYLNFFARLKSEHEIELVRKGSDDVKLITAENIVIATGGTPIIPQVPGGEHCITSNDLFSLPTPPGKTLILGAAYIGLEAAGVLSGLGFDTSVMVRSKVLRKFDQQMAKMIQNNLARKGVAFLHKSVLKEIKKIQNNNNSKYLVSFQNIENGQEKQAEFDTVLSAIGRRAQTQRMNLEKIGIALDKEGKIAQKNCQSSVKNIYAIGDVSSGSPELTPFAISQGKLLAFRLYGDSTQKTDYSLIPTAVFTPLEYGSAGLSEEEAISTYKLENIEVYHSYFTPLEFALPHFAENECYIKVICNKLENEKILGIHYFGPNAGEIIQGFAASMKCGITKSQLDSTLGIHPTCAENFTNLDVTKRSGKDPKKTGC